MPNFIEIGGVTPKPLVDLTWNDPIATVFLQTRQHSQVDAAGLRTHVLEPKHVSEKKKEIRYKLYKSTIYLHKTVICRN